MKRGTRIREKLQAINSATEAVEMILRIDDVIAAGKEKPSAPMPEEYNLLFFGHQKTTRIAMTIIVNPSCIIVASSIICVPNLGEKIPV